MTAFFHASRGQSSIAICAYSQPTIFRGLPAASWQRRLVRRLVIKAVRGAALDAAELFDVDVDELAGRRAPVTLSRLEADPPEPADPDRFRSRDTVETAIRAPRRSPGR